MGAKDEGSEKFLRGATIGVAVCDEIVLMPKGFFQMLLTRMSPTGARFYGSTNPDSPMHWLKTEYLDDPVLRTKGLLSSMHVTMDDNPNLSAEYIASQKALYKGMFYQRYILGLWVMAEGSIYRDAWSDDLLYDDPTTPIGLYNPGGYVDRWVSVDCGVDHPQVYLEYHDDGDTVWVSNQYRWDSRKEMRQKTDGQYADDLVEFMGRNRSCQVILPPECASFKAELVLRGLWVTEAENEVLEGIQSVSGLMAKRKLRIHRQRCASLAAKIQTYCWDQKAALRGVEQPLKQDDDDPDALRYGVHRKIPRWRFA
jgi:PBSX family phage terminase large subunit